ncbi:MAG: hypothetical protein FJY07_05105, partial [Bacteroidetes bacterium]|nr:hypothetical protein [Bacteroidota bacterium]
MKTSKLILGFLVTLIVTANSFGQFTRQQAIDLILNNTLLDDIESIDVYCANNSNTGDVEMIDNVIVENPNAESWVFFVDDNPFASWYHQARYIFVFTVDGAYTIANGEIYPKSWKTDYEEISSADRPDPVAIDGTAFVPDPQKVESNYNYALIVVAMDEYRNWYNTSLIYNVLLLNYNYKKDNIFVLYSYDGHSWLPNVNGDDLDDPADPSDDIDGPATWATVQQVLAEMKGEEPNPVYVTEALGHGDQLAVFFTGVPVENNGPNPVMLFQEEEGDFIPIPVSDVSELMEDIDCGQMVFTFDVSSAGDVIPHFMEVGGTDVKCKNRFLHGPTVSGQSSKAEMYFSSGNYSEYLYYWAAAARGFLPDASAPWQTILPAIGEENLGGFPYLQVIPNHPGDDTLDVNLDGFIQMGEAFTYANKMDTWSDDGYCYIPYIIGQSEIPTATDEFPFTDDLITLSGLSGGITTTTYLPTRSYIIADELWAFPIQSTLADLYVDDNAELHINRLKSSMALFSVTGYVNLILGEDVLITTEEPFNGISNKARFWTYNASPCSLTIGENTTFEKIKLDIDGGIPPRKMVFDYCTFSDSRLLLQWCDVTFNHSNFDNSRLQAVGKDVNIRNCNFDHSVFYSYPSNSSSLDTVIVDSSYFTGICTHYLSSGISSIFIQGYEQYKISNSTFEAGNNLNSGIEITFCGMDRYNIVQNNIVFGYTAAGIRLYSSYGDLFGNYVYGNVNDGISLQNNASINITP